MLEWLMVGLICFTVLQSVGMVMSAQYKDGEALIGVGLMQKLCTATTDREIDVVSWATSIDKAAFNKHWPKLSYKKLREATGRFPIQQNKISRCRMVRHMVEILESLSIPCYV
jgi:hypothetical protein